MESQKDISKTVKKEKRTPKDNNGRWSQAEHQRFLDGLRKYGRQWRFVRDRVKTRTVTQVRTHAQKYFAKMHKPGRDGIECSGKRDIDYVGLHRMKLEQQKRAARSRIKTSSSNHKPPELTIINPDKAGDSMSTLLEAVNQDSMNNSAKPRILCIQNPNEIRFNNTLQSPKHQEYEQCENESHNLLMRSMLTLTLCTALIEITEKLETNIQKHISTLSLSYFRKRIRAYDGNFETVGEAVKELRQTINGTSMKPSERKEIIHTLQEELIRLSSECRFSFSSNSQYVLATIHQPSSRSKSFDLGLQHSNIKICSTEQIKNIGSTNTPTQSTNLTSRLPSLASVVSSINKSSMESSKSPTLVHRHST